jgi:ATP-binding cassette, subfamily C (CFTR/MRP), member 1
LWLNVWTADNATNPNGKMGYYIGIYMLFGLLNVIFMTLQFYTFMIIIVPYSAKLLHRRVLTAVMQ